MGSIKIVIINEIVEVFRNMKFGMTDVPCEVYTELKMVASMLFRLSMNFCWNKY